MPDNRPGRGRALPALGMNAAAFAWGLAEATLFFLVPDILLSWLALENARAAWRACAWALAGALLGGLIMFAWSAWDHSAALTTLDCIPAISPAMCDDVREQLRTHGVLSLFIGPLLGTPYKIYAVQASSAGIPLSVFLIVSAPARLLRFVLLTGLAVVARRMARRLSVRAFRVAHLAAWAAFYTWYFWHF